MQSITYDQVKDKIIEIRNQQIIIDADVAQLYGVKTKHVNEAVKNNPEKFPHDYIIELSIDEKNELVENFDQFNKLKHSTGTIKGFTEKSLYMLATILKSPKAISTTLAIIDTFSKVRELDRVVKQMAALPENSSKQNALIKYSGTLLADFIVHDDELKLQNTETTYEINLAIFKVRKTIKKSSKERAIVT